jgi:hypothetical protein
MAKVDDLKGCVMLEDMRASKLEGEIRRSAEMLKIFEQQVAGTIATEVLSSLEQFTLSYDRQLKEIRQVIDGVNTLQCETARSVGEVSKTVGKVSKTVDGVAMVSMGTRSQSDAHASTLTQLKKRIDQQLLHQQQQVEMNEVFLEAIGCEERMLKSTAVPAGDSGLEMVGEEACVVCGIEGEERLHPSDGECNMAMTSSSKDNQGDLTIEYTVQGFVMGCNPDSALVHASSSYLSNSDSSTVSTASLVTLESRSIFDSPLEIRLRQADLIRSSNTSLEFEVPCSVVQMKFLADMWIQYRQTPRDMLAWVKHRVEMADMHEAHEICGLFTHLNRRSEDSSSEEGN